MDCPQGCSSQYILVLQDPSPSPGPWVGAGEWDLDKALVCGGTMGWGRL